MKALRVLFIRADVGGNVAPTSALLCELLRRGHSVTHAGNSGRASWPDEVRRIHFASLREHDVTKPAGRLGHAPALARLALSRALRRECETRLSVNIHTSLSSTE